MSQKHRFNILNFVILLICVAAIAGAVLYYVKEGSVIESIQYVDSDLGVTFDYPASVNPIDEKVGDHVQIVNFFPRGKENLNRELISLTYVKADPVQTVEEAAGEYLQVNTSDVKKVAREDIQSAKYVKYKFNDEVSVYNFFKNGQRFYVLKYNQKIFDRNNPLIMVDNSAYSPAYTKILNSITFDQ